MIKNFYDEKKNENQNSRTAEKNLFVFKTQKMSRFLLFPVTFWSFKKNVEDDQDAFGKIELK